MFSDNLSLTLFLLSVYFKGIISEGTYVVLNFFATWCNPCMIEMEHFSAAQEKYRDKNVTFLMVNVQYPSGDTMEDLDYFVNTTDHNFDNILI